MTNILTNKIDDVTGQPISQDEYIRRLEDAAEYAERLKRELDDVRRRDQFHADQLNELGDAIMGLIGDKVEALAESAVERAIGDGITEALSSEFRIDDYQTEIEDMVDDRLAERMGTAIEDSDDHREAIENMVKDVLSGATLSIDI